MSGPFLLLSNSWQQRNCVCNGRHVFLPSFLEILFTEEKWHPSSQRCYQKNVLVHYFTGTTSATITAVHSALPNVVWVKTHGNAISSSVHPQMWFKGQMSFYAFITYLSQAIKWEYLVFSKWSLSSVIHLSPLTYMWRWPRAAGGNTLALLGGKNPIYNTHCVVGSVQSLFRG